MSAPVTVKCEQCGGPVQPAAPGGTTPRHCSKACRFVAYRMRHGLRCLVCGGPPESRQRDRVTWLCQRDANLVWRTCEGKWAAGSAAEILDVHRYGGCEFQAYECPMCLRWHRTSGPAEVTDEQQARQLTVGAILRASGFQFRQETWWPVSAR